MKVVVVGRRESAARAEARDRGIRESEAPTSPRSWMLQFL